MRSPATSSALPAPSRPPTTQPISATQRMEACGWTDSQSAETKAPVATMAPTDRSICRAMMMSACPSATMQTSVAERATCSRLALSRKRGSRRVTAAQMMASAKINASSLTRSNRARTPPWRERASRPGPDPMPVTQHAAAERPMNVARGPQRGAAPRGRKHRAWIPWRCDRCGRRGCGRPFPSVPQRHR